MSGIDAIYALIGAAGGLLAGLLGIGGGLVIVPALLWVFPYEGLPAAGIAHAAVATSLATVTVTSLAAAYAQHRRGAVDWPLLRVLAPGLAAGALAGAVAAAGLTAGTIKVVFGLFALAVAAQMGLGLRVTRQGRLPAPSGLLAIGALIGAFSAMVGVGGGTLTVPLLHWGRVTMQRAVATASACGFPIAVGGSVGFTIARGAEAGAIYWPAALWIAAVSVLAAPLGVRLAHRLSTAWLTRVFSLVLGVVALRLILG